MTMTTIRTLAVILVSDLYTVNHTLACDLMNCIITLSDLCDRQRV